MMKKTALSLTAMLIAATAFAQQEVLSVNAVGFIKVDVPAGQYEALSFPFYNRESADGSTAWTDTAIAKEAENGSSVYFWNGDAWNGGALLVTPRMTNWGATVRNRRILPGEMFMYKPSADQTCLMSGEVPDDNQMEVPIAAGGNYSAIASPYPVSVAWTNFPVAQEANNGDAVYFWNGTDWIRGALIKSARSTNWAASVRDWVVDPGRGFFFKAASGDAKSSTFDRPYKWPAETAE